MFEDVGRASRCFSQIFYGAVPSLSLAFWGILAFPVDLFHVLTCIPRSKFFLMNWNISFSVPFMLKIKNAFLLSCRFGPTYIWDSKIMCAWNRLIGDFRAPTFTSSSGYWTDLGMTQSWFISLFESSCFLLVRIESFFESILVKNTRSWDELILFTASLLET